MLEQLNASPTLVWIHSQATLQFKNNINFLLKKQTEKLVFTFIKLNALSDTNGNFFSSGSIESGSGIVAPL